MMRKLRSIGRRIRRRSSSEHSRVAAQSFDRINTDLIAAARRERGSFIRSFDEVSARSPENITVHTFCVKRAAELAERGAATCVRARMRDGVAYSQRRCAELGYEPYYMYKQKKCRRRL